MACIQQQFWKKVCHCLPNIRDILNCFFSVDLPNISMAPTGWNPSLQYDLQTEKTWESFQLLYSGVSCRISQIWNCLECFERTSVSKHLLATVTVTKPLADEWPHFYQVWSILARPRGMPLWCEEEATSAAFFVLLFSAVSYALQSWSSTFLYVGSDIEFIFMHRGNDFIVSNPPSIS